MSKVSIQGDQNGTGDFTIKAPNSNTDRTLTLPDEAGTLGLSDKISEGNSSVEVVDAGTGHVAVTVDGTEISQHTSTGYEIKNTTPALPGAIPTAFRISRSDNSSTLLSMGPSEGVQSASNPGALISSSNRSFQIGTQSDRTNGNFQGIYVVNAFRTEFYADGTEQMRLDQTGDLSFNSGFGSVATAYGCRAWVNWDGTGTPSIRDSGNVSSITDFATGRFGINFSTNMPDDNSSVVGLSGRSGGAGERYMSLRDIFSGSVRVGTRNAERTFFDNDLNCVSVFR